MTLIVPITEMRGTSKMFQFSGNQLVFIIKNSYGSGELISIDHYNRTKDVLRDIELEERYRRSEYQGGNVEAHDFIKRLLEERL